MSAIEACNCCCIEVKVILSATDLFKAIRLGGTLIDEAEIKNLWYAQQDDPALRAELTAAAAHAFHLGLSEYTFESVFENPSPFVVDRTQWGSF